jgi:hypothetical protein
MHEINGDQRLVAYLVTRGSATIPKTSELRAGLAVYLPDYKVPGFYVGLEGFSLTLNGKLDYKALPDPELGMDANVYVAPEATDDDLVTYDGVTISNNVL